MRKSILKYTGMILLLALAGCKSEGDETTPLIDDKDFATPDWTDASHGNKAAVDYATVFTQDKVNTLEIRMTAADWTTIQKNVNSLFGFSFGVGGARPDGTGFPEEDPEYVAVSLKFNGAQWYKVGFRLKGNSSLQNSWGQGIYKLPFRLNFDKFEDDYPQIKNQRFYGFKELSLSPGANDNSLIREKAGAAIFRMAGIPCSQTSFYKVYIDFGAGLKYCSVYTLVEVVDDTMIKDQFGEDKGNIYKPESALSVFVASQFEKKNNEDDNDFSDVQVLIDILNSTTRTSNASQWRADLEKVMDVHHFLKWLAVNTTMFNWDTYGTMAHNYYLYHHSSQGLTWIPWDNNESMMSRPGSTITMSLSGVTSAWPLIRNLMDDPVYHAQYKTEIKEFNDTVFTSAKMNELFDRYHQLIAPYVTGPEETEQGKYTHLTSAASFSNELTTLKQHVVSRNQAVKDYLK